MSANINDFKPLATDGQVKALANLLPSGLIWQAKYIKGSNLYKLLLAISQEFARIEFSQYALASGFIPSTTMGFIEEWEKFLGLPDKCLKTDVPLYQRRLNIIAKLGYLNLFTKQDYYDLAELFEVNILTFDNSVFGYINITVSGTFDANVSNIFDMHYSPVIDPIGAFVFGSFGEAFFTCLVKNYSPAFIQVNVTGDN